MPSACFNRNHQCITTLGTHRKQRLKQIFQSEFILDNATVGVFFYTKTGNHCQSDGTFSFGVGYKTLHPIFYLFTLCFGDGVFSTAKFHFAEIYAMVCPVDKQVDLRTTLCLRRRAPTIYRSLHTLNFECSLNLWHMIQA